ncbi:YqaA family protein [Lacibacterium aquatile]|uniref:YqaA family protein n=1 Tax=Lacibacterium aquatile TaxID=1168082 RepID=A0ABW5DQG5_9PROT
MTTIAKIIAQQIKSQIATGRLVADGEEAGGFLIMALDLPLLPGRSRGNLWDCLTQSGRHGMPLPRQTGADLRKKLMLRRLYDWILSLSASPRAVPAMSTISFLESSVFPIPPDLMLIPMCIAKRAKAWFYATVCTLSSVAGGLVGYAIGYFAWELAMNYVPTSWIAGIAKFQADFAEWGPWAIIGKGWTPFPFKIVTIASGVAHLDLFTFIWASIISRALRFYLVAGLLYYFGQPIRDFIEKRLTLVTMAAVVLIVSGFVALKYL